MNELQISLSGKITDTNFDEWKADLLKQIKSSRRELQTDDDFALAESDVKTLRAGEKSLKAAKQSALEQAAEINKLFDAIDEISEEARQARLTLERQIKQRKEEIRDEIVDAGMQQIEDFINGQSENFHTANKERFISRAELESYTKGKRGTSGIQKAIDEAVVGVKHRIQAKAATVTTNEALLNDVDDGYGFLFQDHPALLAIDTDVLKQTITERIELYRAEQEKLANEQAAAEPEPAPTPAQPDSETDAPAQEPPTAAPAPSAVAVEGRFIISIEVFADAADAAELMDELEGRLADRDMVGEIKMSRD